MKPRAFIGSSVEGLPVAYAVQQNLLHDAEITVWDQGVFELSSTTIESLMNVISSVDFGIFIFAAEDIVKIREKETRSVRDNVLFEFGLFIGKLGRDRVFFLVPIGLDFHIPTDLIGITPGKYEVDRSDGSMQAATGPASHQIRNQMKKLGLMESRNVVSSPPEDSVKNEAEKKPWIIDFIDGKYDLAKAKITDELKLKSGDEAIECQAWIGYCEVKMNPKLGFGMLDELVEKHLDSSYTQRSIASIFRLERHLSRAIAILYKAKSLHPADHAIDIDLSQAHAANEDSDEAVNVLKLAGPSKHPFIALALANLFEEQGRLEDALEVVQACYAFNPGMDSIAFKYARIAQELGFHTVSLYLLDDLAGNNPKSIEYWGYLGNSCLSLELHDRALASYRKAENLIESNDNEWIISNIGNLFSNISLPTEACVFLEKALTTDPRSEYAHDRLARALKSKDENLKAYKAKCKEGFKIIRDVSKKHTGSSGAD